MNKRRPRPHQAFTLLEVTITSALMVVLMIFLGEAFRQSQKVFRNTTATSDASGEIRGTIHRISRDLRQAQRSLVNTTNVPASLFAPDGSALWFLSNLDSVTQQPLFLSDGSPRWQRNILYYLVVPNNHAGLFGITCGGGIGPGPLGHDDRCPHKVLIRKEIDFPPATSPIDEVVEPLMTPAQIANYLTRPIGYSTTNMSAEPGLEEVSIVARRMLGFEVLPSGGGVFADGGPIDIELRATGIARAQKEVAIGSTSLYNSPLTYHFSLTINPNEPIAP